MFIFIKYLPRRKERVASGKLKQETLWAESASADWSHTVLLAVLREPRDAPSASPSSRAPQRQDQPQGQHV